MGLGVNEQCVPSVMWEERELRVTAGAKQALNRSKDVRLPLPHRRVARKVAARKNSCLAEPRFKGGAKQLRRSLPYSTTGLRGLRTARLPQRSVGLVPVSNTTGGCQGSNSQSSPCISCLMESLIILPVVYLTRQIDFEDPTNLMLARCGPL